MNDPGVFLVISFHNVNMKVVPMRPALEDLCDRGENGRGSMLEEKELRRFGKNAPAL